MTVFTVHVTHDDAERAADAAFVPERFSWGAFLLTPLWLLWHRLWLNFLVWCAAIGLVMVATSPASLARGLAAFLIALLCGLEGWDWVRQKLEGQGRGVADLVTGDSLEDAETHFYHRGTWSVSSAASLPRSSIQSGFAASAASETPFGLFPDPESRS